jgi:hypothetical protein
MFDDGSFGKKLLDTLLSGLPHSTSPFAIGQKGNNGLSQSIDIAHRNEKAGDAIDDLLAAAANIGRNDWQASGHGL